MKPPALSELWKGVVKFFIPARHPPATITPEDALESARRLCEKNRWTWRWAHVIEQEGNYLVETFYGLTGPRVLILVDGRTGEVIHAGFVGVRRGRRGAPR